MHVTSQKSIVAKHATIESKMPNNPGNFSNLKPKHAARYADAVNANLEMGNKSQKS
jgi:hypothetical protein